MAEGPYYEDLRIELETDPAGLGYAPYIAAGQMTVLADILNQVRAGTNIQKRQRLLREEIMVCWDLAEYESMTADYQQYANFLVQNHFEASDLPALMTIIRNLFYFGAPDHAPITYAAIEAVQVREGSRAEELWDTNWVVKWFDCETALQTPLTPPM